jgi:hypothetical protein
MPQFEFADFIEEFKVDFIAHIPQPGYYADGGKWIKGVTTATPMEGIILPHSSPGYSDGIRFEANGVTNEAHRKVYTTIPMPVGTIIEYKGNTFTVDGEKEYSAYADVYIYIAKGVKK